MSLKWLTTHCRNAAFFLKSDDDVLVNIFEYMTVAETAAREHSRLIVCAVWRAKTMPILRDPKTCKKWCVDPSEFPGKETFPQYCSGITITFSRGVFLEMYGVAAKTPFFWVDDVFLTGLVAAKLKGVYYVDVMSNFIKPNSKRAKEKMTLMTHEHGADGHMRRWAEILRRHKLSGLQSFSNKTNP